MVNLVPNVSFCPCLRRDHQPLPGKCIICDLAAPFAAQKIVDPELIGSCGRRLQRDEHTNKNKLFLHIDLLEKKRNTAIGYRGDHAGLNAVFFSAPVGDGLSTASQQRKPGKSPTRYPMRQQLVRLTCRRANRRDRTPEIAARELITTMKLSDPFTLMLPMVFKAT